MALKTFNPITPSNRYKEWPDYSSLDKRKPEKSLLFTKKKTGGGTPSATTASWW